MQRLGNRRKVLPKEEQVELVLKAQKGDLLARNRLIEHSFGLVTKEAFKYKPNKSIDPEDLFQEGIFGLIEAIRMYNPQKGMKFSSYAKFWIFQSIRRYIVNLSKTIRIPFHIHDDYRKAQKAISKFEIINGRKPEIDELSSLTKMDRNRLEQILTIIPKISYPSNSTIEDTEEDYIFFVSPVKSISPQTYVLAADELETYAKDVSLLFEAIENFSERDRNIFVRYYGMDNNLEKRSFKVIGEEAGISRERVRQIIERIWLTLPKYGFLKDQKWFMEIVERIQALGVISNQNFNEISNYILNSRSLCKTK